MRIKRAFWKAGAQQSPLGLSRLIKERRGVAKVGEIMALEAAHLDATTPALTAVS